MPNGTEIEPRSAAVARGANPGPGGGAANVIPFAPRRKRPAAERPRGQAALQALARHRAAADRYALAGHELVSDLRAGCDPDVAVATFKRKVGQD